MANKKNKTKNKINRKTVYIAAAVVAAVIAVLCFAFDLSSENSIGDKMVMPELNYETASKTSFHISDKNVFYCSKDGMRLLDEKGNTVWTDTYTMQQPVLIGDGGYAAVAEERGRVVRVYDTTGFIYEIKAENPITTFTLNKMGYSAVIMEMPNEYLTNIYNSLGSVVSISSCPVDENIPVAVAVSDDSSVYATAYIDTNSMTFKSNVAMRYIGKQMAASTETVDGMFTAFSGGNGIVGMLDFAGDTALSAISDKEIIMADISAGTCTEKLRAETGGVMTAVDIGENGYVAAALRTENGGHINCYTKVGKSAASFDTENEVAYLKVYDDIILAVSGPKLIAYDFDGKQIWAVITGQDVKQAFMFGTGSEVLIAGNNKMRVIRVKKGETVNEVPVVEKNIEPEIVREEETDEVTEIVEITTEQAEPASAADEDVGEDEEYSESDYDEADYSDDDEEYSEDYDDEDYSDDDEDYYEEDDDESYDDEEYNENDDYDEDDE